MARVEVEPLWNIHATVIIIISLFILSRHDRASTLRKRLELFRFEIKSAKSFRVLASSANGAKVEIGL